jgi:hypothetical protein
VAVAMRNEQNRLTVSLSEAGKSRFKTLGRAACISLATMKCHRHKVRTEQRLAAGVPKRKNATKTSRVIASARVGPTMPRT